MEREKEDFIRLKFAVESLVDRVNHLAEKIENVSENIIQFMNKQTLLSEKVSKLETLELEKVSHTVTQLCAADVFRGIEGGIRFENASWKVWGITISAIITALVGMLVGLFFEG